MEDQAEQHQPWWQRTRKPLVIGLTVALVVVIALILLEVRLYGTGLAGRTLWDWLQLLIIPVVLALGVWWLNRLQQQEAGLGFVQKSIRGV